MLGEIRSSHNSQALLVGCKNGSTVWESNLAAPQMIKPGGIAQPSHSIPRHMPIRNNNMYIENFTVLLMTIVVVILKICKGSKCP